MTSRPHRRAQRALATVCTAVGLLLGTAIAVPATVVRATAAPSSATPTSNPAHPLVLAHFYIWFNRASWRRAKIDLPLAGPYSSSDRSIMRQQIHQAKSAGIDGFIVSWKNTPTLDSRLRTLVSVAEDEHFPLAITYQGLTFDHMNVPIQRVAADLDYFVKEFASRPAFRMYRKPLVVLTGTAGWTAREVASLTGTRRKRLTVLASEKNIEGYTRIAPYVDGDLYYWSSVNPATFGNYRSKLATLGAAVRSHHGIWVAPVAPGFDARLVGGKSQVERDSGATLRTEWNAALQSNPSAIGIISWNEFSENTYVEPSHRYGDAYIQTIRSLTGSTVEVSDFDSSAPAGAVNPLRPIMIFAGFGLLLGLCSIVAVRRRRLLTS